MTSIGEKLKFQMSLKVAQNFSDFQGKFFVAKDSPWPFKSSPKGENSPNLATLERDFLL
jgi:hypothetical protein